MPMDDASTASDPNMDSQAPMDDQMPMDDSMGQEMNNGEMPMDNSVPSDMEGDETIDIINKLSPKDKEAVKSYAESLVSQDENNNETNDEAMPDGLNMEAPVNETFIFKKEQLNKIMENFGPTKDELEKTEKPKLLKKGKKNIENSPFNSPEFN